MVLAAITLDFAVSTNLILGQRAIYGLSEAHRSRLNGLFMAFCFVGGRSARRPACGSMRGRLVGRLASRLRSAGRSAALQRHGKALSLDGPAAFQTSVKGKAAASSGVAASAAICLGRQLDERRGDGIGLLRRLAEIAMMQRSQSGLRALQT